MKTACVILAAGQGKRMRSDLVKVLHPLCGEPMIDYPVSLALARECNPVVAVIGSQAEEVRTHLNDRWGDRVQYALQSPPRGTGHAVKMAKKAMSGFRGKLLILYGDVPLLTKRQLIALHRGASRTAVAFLTCRLKNPAGYGRVARDERGRVVRIVEHVDATKAERRIDEINTGIYLVDAPFVFDALDKVGCSNSQGEYYLTDLIEEANRRNRGVVGIEVEDNEVVMGVNDRMELAQASRVMNQRLLERLMSRGVTVVDPANAYVGPRVKIGRDSVLNPACMLVGDVRIGRGCTIGPGVYIKDSRIGKDAEIRAYSHLEECRVGDRAQVGPFARLRLGTELASEVRVGNFVETKKARLDKGSKASHLSYLGDATIGKDVNIGAGTITCNYDGQKKHPTLIENGAFIGSGSQFVAPVRIGKNGYVGAGTTVTRDVPSDALAISRVKQRNIEGFARRMRELRSSSK